jgi:hypothetical protein
VGHVPRRSEASDVSTARDPVLATGNPACRYTRIPFFFFFFFFFFLIDEKKPLLRSHWM